MTNSAFESKEQEIKSEIEKILSQKIDINKSLLYELHGYIDHTSLNCDDSVGIIEEFIDEVNQYAELNPNVPPVAAICVYPNFVRTARRNLDVEEINIASVAGFPSSQTFFSIKFAEAKMAVERGADEIDLVFPLAKYFDANYEEVQKEISVFKELLKTVTLKVILETGKLRNYQDVYDAARYALDAGADFVKTSTGKEQPAATPEAFYVMARAVLDHYNETGEKKGIKVAGGVATIQDAVKYYGIVKHVFGTSWLNKDLFRIGSSKLSENIRYSLAGS